MRNRWAARRPCWFGSAACRCERRALRGRRDWRAFDPVLPDGFRHIVDPERTQSRTAGPAIVSAHHGAIDRRIADMQFLPAGDSRVVQVFRQARPFIERIFAWADPCIVDDLELFCGRSVARPNGSIAQLDERRWNAGDFDARAPAGHTLYHNAKRGLSLQRAFIGGFLDHQSALRFPRARVACGSRYGFDQRGSAIGRHRVSASRQRNDHQQGKRDRTHVIPFGHGGLD